MTDHMLEQLCEDCAAWQRTGSHLVVLLLDMTTRGDVNPASLYVCPEGREAVSATR
jgi:hypothetical protein